MAFNKLKHLEKLVSVFVIVAIIIIVSALLLMGSFGKWFASRTEYYTYLSSASGLSKGMDIKLRGIGFEIGQVEDFSLTNDNRVLLKLSVFNKYTSKLRVDSVLYVKKPTIGILGKVYIEISTGSENLPKLKANAFIPSNKTFEGRLIIASQRGQGAQEEDSDINLPTPIKLFLTRINNILDPERPYMKHMEEILFRVKGILTTVDKYGMLSVVGSRGFQHNVESITQGINEIANRQLREMMDKVVSVMTTVEATSNVVIGVRLPRIMQNLENIMVRAESVLRNLERSPIFGGRATTPDVNRERATRRRRGPVLLE
jgi:hypothetical protein